MDCVTIFCFRFFHESLSLKPLKITVGSFRIFSKVHGDICKSRCTTSVNDTGGKFATGVNDTRWQIAASINDTGGKFATGINDTGANFATISPCAVDTGGKFATGVNDTDGKLPPVSTKPVANCHRYQRHQWQIIRTISGCRHLKMNMMAKI